MFFEAIGVGLGVGIIHAFVLAFVLFAARSNTRNREDETLDLMRERNALDRQKVDAMRAMRHVTRDDVERFIRNLEWGDNATEETKTIVAGNIRHFWKWCGIRLGQQDQGE